MDYAPDLPLRTPELLADINNFVPDVSGNYVTAPVPFSMEALTATTTTDPIIGAAAFRSNISGSMSNYLFYGSTKKIYSGTHAAVSATTYSVLTTGSWCFASFGSAIIAANGSSLLQAAPDLSSPVFADIAGAPAAKIVFEHENALVALNIAGNDDGWACSDTGDYTQWSAGASNFADSGDLFGGSGGPLTAGTAWGKLAVAFKANAMYLGQRVEEIDRTILWEKVSDTIGCPAIHGWIKTEAGLIFVSQTDILLYDGSKPRSIADRAIRREFNRRITTFRDRVFLTHDDAEKNIYFWHNPSPQQDIYPTAAFVFNYKSGKWGKVDTIQTNGTSYVQARCPVVGAVGINFYAVSVSGNTMENNGPGSNQLVMHNTSSSFRANFWYRATNSGGTAITRATTGKPAMTTGYIGQHDADSTLSRLYVVPESFGYTSSGAASGSSVDPETATVTVISEDGTQYTANASINDLGMVDIKKTGRYFQSKITWPATVHRQTISLLTPEFVKMAKGR